MTQLIVNPVKNVQLTIEDDGQQVVLSVADNVGPMGPQGPAGEAGPQGLQGPKGDPGSDATVTSENVVAALGFTPATADQGALADSAVQPSDIADVVRDADPRLTDSRAPTGAAGGVLSGSYPNPGFAVDMATQAELESGLAGKVDKVAGKQLSTEDYTSAEKSKLAGIAAGAQVNTVASVAGKTGAVTLAKGDVGLGNVDNTSDATKSIGGNAATATLASDSSKLGGQLPSYYAQQSQVNDIELKQWMGV